LAILKLEEEEIGRSKSYVPPNTAKSQVEVFDMPTHRDKGISLLLSEG